MSRGISAIGSNVISLENLKDWVKGDVEEVKGNEYYLPGRLLEFLVLVGLETDRGFLQRACDVNVILMSFNPRRL